MKNKVINKLAAGMLLIAMCLTTVPASSYAMETNGEFKSEVSVQEDVGVPQSEEMQFDEKQSEEKQSDVLELQGVISAKNSMGNSVGEEIALIQDNANKTLTGNLPIYTSTVDWNATDFQLELNGLAEAATAKLIVNKKEYPFDAKTVDTGNDKVIETVGEHRFSVEITTAGKTETYTLILNKDDNMDKIGNESNTLGWFKLNPEVNWQIDNKNSGTLFQIGEDGSVTDTAQFKKNCYNYTAFVTPDVTSIKITKPINAMALFNNFSGGKQETHLELYVDGDVRVSTKTKKYSSGLSLAVDLAKVVILTDQPETKIMLVLSDIGNPMITSHYYFTIVKLNGDVAELPAPQINNITLPEGYAFTQGGGFKPDTIKYGLEYLEDIPTLDFIVDMHENTKLYHTEVDEKYLVSKNDDNKSIVKVNLTKPLKLIAKEAVEMDGKSISSTKEYNFAFTEKERSIEERGTHEPDPPLRTDIDVADRLVEYCPAEGLYAEIRSVSDFNWMYEAKTAWNRFATLGGFGGYMTFAFDKPIVNDPNNPYGTDFIIYGNNFGYVPEPGGVLVSSDGENWYELAGSMHYELTTEHNVKATLLNGKEVKHTQIAKGVDGKLNVGTLKPVYGYADVHKCSGNDNAEGIWTVDCALTGDIYTENHISTMGDAFDLDWAVDADGKPTEVDNIKYIRVYNTVDFKHPTFGTNSPELATVIRAAEDEKPVGLTENLSSLKVDGQELDINEKSARYYEIKLDNTAKSAIKVEAKGKEGDHIVINNNIYEMEASEYLLLDKNGSRMLRVLVQNGKKEPIIYTVKVTGGGDSAANADLLSVALTPGDREIKVDSVPDNKFIFNVSNSIKNIKLKFDSLNPASEMILSGNTLDAEVSLVSGVQTENVIELNEGKNSFTVKVFSKDKSNTKEYYVEVNRAKSETEDQDISVKFCFTGDAVHGCNEDGTPKPGHEVQTWIAETTVKIPKGSTVKYITDMMLYNKGIRFDDTDGTYIAKVWHPTENRWLGQFDNGKNSGWMYRHNRKIADEGYATRILENGDSVKWFYTDDYTKEKGYEGNWTKSGGEEDIRELNSAIATIETTAKTDANGKAQASVSSKDMTNTLKEALTNAKKLTDDGKKNVVPEVEVKVKADLKAIFVETSIPTSSMKELAKEDKVQLKVSTPVGDLTFDNAALEEMIKNSAGNDVKISIAKADTAKLPDAVKAKIEQIANGKPAFELSVKAADINITNFGKGKATVTVEYSLAQGENPEDLVVYFVNDNGSAEVMECKYDATSKKLTFTTEHFSLYVIGYNENSGKTLFNDVKSSDWFYNAVLYVCNNKSMNGTSETTFEPKSNITRAMVAQILYNMEGKPTVNKDNAFTDVDSSKWYYNAVTWAAQNDIANGTTKTNFAPNDKVTREQVAQFLYRYSKLKKYNISKTYDLSEFTDGGKVSPWAVDAMQWSVGNKIISGKGNGVLDAKGTATRAEIAQMIKNFKENVK